MGVTFASIKRRLQASVEESGENWWAEITWIPRGEQV